MNLPLLKEKYGDKKVLITSSDNTGCGLLRTYYPFQFLKDNFVSCEHSFGFPAGDPRIQDADIIWLQRANHEVFQQLIPSLQAQGKKIVMDMDDTLWHIPATNLAHRHYPKKELDKVDAVCRLVDCLTASTQPLADFLSDRFNKEVFVIQNHIWKQDEIIGEKPQNEKIKIGWAGSYTHLGDFDHHLVNVLRGLPYDKVEFYSMGFTPQFFKPFAQSLPWVETKDFHNVFSAQNWDIGIMVAQDNMFNRCKSNLKYLEYGSIKCAAIGHTVYPYTTTIEHGIDGLLVKKEKTDWKEHIYRLIEDEPFRKQLAEAAYEKVNKFYTYEGDREVLEQKYIQVLDYLYEGKN